MRNDIMKANLIEKAKNGCESQWFSQQTSVCCGSSYSARKATGRRMRLITVRKMLVVWGKDLGKYKEHSVGDNLVIRCS